MQAIGADIHGNLEALRAVLDDIAAQQVSDIYCLGDIVGYGPNPCECIDLVAGCRVAVLGDHDLAATGGPSLRTPASQRWNLWTRRALALPAPDAAASHRRRNFLASRPVRHREGEYLFVHGEPRDPVNEYPFPEDVYNELKMQAVFALVDRVCFMGHTHVPGIFTDDLQFIPPAQTDDVWELTGNKTLCNVGSVGQPRDGDRRACYVLFDGVRIRFRRVEYDVEALKRKLEDRDNFPSG